MEPLELSIDDVVTDHQPLDAMDTENTIHNTVQRAKTADDSCIVEEVLLEYSCHDDSTCRDHADLENISTVHYSEPSQSLNPLQSSFPHSFYSPSNRTPLKALAQSTPKPSILSPFGFSAVQNDQTLPKDPDTNHHRCTLIDSPSPSCQKALARAVTCQASEVDCNLNDSEVTFGSPSRSFEVAMACEADKLCCGVERDSRTSGLGMFVISFYVKVKSQYTCSITPNLCDRDSHTIQHYSQHFLQHLETKRRTAIITQ